MATAAIPRFRFSCLEFSLLLTYLSIRRWLKEGFEIYYHCLSQPARGGGKGGTKGDRINEGLMHRHHMSQIDLKDLSGCRAMIRYEIENEMKPPYEGYGGAEFALLGGVAQVWGLGHRLMACRNTFIS